MSEKRRIYLDHNATTPLHPVVKDAMVAALRDFGNPSSLHEEGRAARQTVETARLAVAALLNARPGELLFTAGGTESNNTALIGAAHLVRQRAPERLQILTSPLEHPSVGGPLERLRGEGFVVRKLRVDSAGRIALSELQEALAAAPTALVSLALVNHELGNRYPIADCARLAREAGAVFHCDAVQAVGRIPVDVAALGVDLLSVSAHKLYGPKGVGALYIRSDRGAALRELPQLLLGGQQERGRRAGTENVIGIAGFGRAATLCRSELLALADGIAARRDRLEARLLAAIPGARRHGDVEARSPGTANLAFSGVEGELLLINLDLRGIAVSTGAACSSGSIEPSKVILGLGVPREQAGEAVRFSLGIGTTDEDIEQVVAAVAESVEQVRAATR